MVKIINTAQEFKNLFLPLFSHISFLLYCCSVTVAPLFSLLFSPGPPPTAPLAPTVNPHPIVCAHEASVHVL